MRCVLLVAALAAGSLLAAVATAGADINDIDRLSLDDQAFGSAGEVDLSGAIRCQATIDYGLWVYVAQDAAGGPSISGFLTDPDTGIPTGSGAPTEGVGAFGPGFAPPTGIGDDSPCSQSLSAWDVVVTQNRDSADFQGTQMNPAQLGVVVIAGSSAENGGRGPGPFIGDMLQTSPEAVDFERTR